MGSCAEKLYPSTEIDSVSGNEILAGLTARDRLQWAVDNLPETHAVTTSFGAQSAVMLHLATSIKPDLPVIFIDTGYLFPETYRFADQLTKSLDLNLHVFRAEQSTAWQEARYGYRWKLGVDGLRRYNQQVKVEPLGRAMHELHVSTWLSGIRRSQSPTRRNTPFLEQFEGRWKIHAIADWSEQTVHSYLQKHKLPPHPLFEHGYLSIGDYHTTRSIHEVSSEEQLRFFGLQRECGINVAAQPPADS